MPAVKKLDGPYQVAVQTKGPLGVMHDVVLTPSGKVLSSHGGGKDGGRTAAIIHAGELNTAAKLGAADAEQRLKLLRDEVRMIAEGLERDVRLSADPSHPLSRETTENRAGAIRAAISRSENRCSS